MRRFILMLCILPGLLFALDEKECKGIYEEARLEKNRSKELFAEYEKQEELEKGIELVARAKESCDRAVHLYDKLLKDLYKHWIATGWRKSLVDKCGDKKKECLEHSEKYRAILSLLETTLKGKKLYYEGLELFEKAGLKREDYLRNLDNIEEVMTVLYEVAGLYEKASEIGQAALDCLSSDGDKNVLREFVGNCRVEARKARDEAASWPAVILKEREALVGLEKISGKNRSSERNFSKTDSGERREVFFANTIKILHPDLFFRAKKALALDGQYEDPSGQFILFAEQYARFFLERDEAPSSLVIQVFENEEKQYQEVIPLSNISLHKYLTEDGRIYIPDTKLEKEFGLQLRLKWVYNEKGKYSLIVSQKSTSTKYKFVIGLDEEEIYACHYVFTLPWQLKALSKPSFPQKNEVPKAQNISMNAIEGSNTILTKFPVLDQFVKEMKGNPLLLSQYVYNEIEFVDPFCLGEAPPIHRGVLTTFLDKKGSHFEQCALLVYLLREAGYQALYCMGESKEPCVLLTVGDKSIVLAPWMKEVQIDEGYDLYNLLPDRFATPDLFVAHYLQNGKGEFTKEFLRVVNENLAVKRVSLKDVGLHKTQIKKSFISWDEFPHPIKEGSFSYFHEPPEDRFAYLRIDVFSKEHPEKNINVSCPLALLNTEAFSLETDSHLVLKFGDKEISKVALNEGDRTFGIKFSYITPSGNEGFHGIQTLSIDRGTIAVPCFHFGGTTPESTASVYAKYLVEKDEKQKLLDLLSFIGASYFDKCGKAEEILADLHKVHPNTVLAFGLTKVTQDLLPQVDMFWFSFNVSQDLNALLVAERSVNEQKILEEIFQDPNAVSTMTLLQLANQEFLVFSRENFLLAEKFPEAAQEHYFSHIKNLNLRKIQKDPQWQSIKSVLETSDQAYAYMTPRPIQSPDGTYHEMGTLIVSPRSYYALISNNKNIYNGGLGSKFLDDSFAYQAMQPIMEDPKWKSDIRAAFKTCWDTVGDPVDVVSGAFYIDEVDLSFGSLQIRRNYNNQNPMDGLLGHGWKLSLNPVLGRDDDKLYAAEEDGTVIAYRYNDGNERWEIHPGDNPELRMVHAYIKDNVLYGADGSKRFFENDRLIRKIDARGRILEFIYSEDRLIEIQSSNGDFCGFRYTPNGRISEIYAKDGRRIAYRYSSNSDLIEVELPNGAVISYEYDAFHRIIKERKPEGNELENVYDEAGRVIEQKAPVGFEDQMIANAFFSYEEGKTVVTDSRGGSTVYSISDHHIDKIIDPLGNETIQVWEGFPKRIKLTADKRGLTTEYQYDERGNVIQVTVDGINNTFKYNDLNLCVEEEVSGRKTITIYDEEFPYLPKKVISNESVSEFTYNKLGQVEEENHLEARIIWEYDERGFPTRKLEITGTEDPDVVTEYIYNNLGQCTLKRGSDAIEKMSYDIMGNCLEHSIYSLSGELLSSTYRGYNLNNQVIWQKLANPKNITHVDYNAAGLVQASYKAVGDHIACSMYEYDDFGNLIQETNPLGVTTTREYDLMGRVICETKGGLSTHFTYEAGGLVASITSPAGAVTTMEYTTNGLLKEEIYPDGTRSHFVYDEFGRIVYEEKNGIVRKTEYDDESRKVVSFDGVREFDTRGNIIRFTDAAGYTIEKTYDGLNRIKTETSAIGEVTTWSYQGDQVICTLPNGEEVIQRLAAGQVIESNNGLVSYDPKTDIQTVIQGDVITITEMNELGLPVRVQKGDIVTLYEYDLVGQCTTIIDGEGRRTSQKFDALGRVIQKVLPDGEMLEYVYDADSNLTEYHTLNDQTWKVSYDLMGRKLSDGDWSYTYENGYLTKTTDPLGRIHSYHYNSDGRLIQETVGDWSRVYTYDSKGLVTSIRQRRENNAPWYRYSNAEESLIEREYDPSGRIVKERTSLNGTILQTSEQIWSSFDRRLKVNNHERVYRYSEGKLVQLSANGVNLEYAYSLSGTPIQIGQKKIDLNSSGLPVTTKTPHSTEHLDWDGSGKLSQLNEIEFAYDTRGRLEPIKEDDQKSEYDAMGQMILQEGKTFEWDPWGKLIKVISDTFIWEASYDALGRRLQTRYTQANDSTEITTSFYDPEDEFGEIGVSKEGKTFWKLCGLTSCDAVIDEYGNSEILYHNALGHLSDDIPVFGPEVFTYFKWELTSYAHSLQWHSKSLDPTGLIWMGARYYNPKTGKFLSKDPIGYPNQLDLYTYANGDPVNFIDPDGRFASYAYQATESAILNTPASRIYESIRPALFATCRPIHAFQQRTMFTNNLLSYFGKKGSFDSCYYEVGSFDLPNGCIGFMNGIDNTREEAMATAIFLSEYAGGAKVYGIHNKTHHWLVDLAECVIARPFGFHTPPVQLVKNRWHDFIATHGPDAKYLQICHSGGAIHVRNALMTSPKWVRDRIIVVAIAPGEIIPSSLCYKAVNYVSRDIVPATDIFGMDAYKNDIHILEPHPDAHALDHPIASPTYRPRLQEQIENYIRYYGGK